MTFFSPRPEPQPEPEPPTQDQFFVVPWQPPVNALPGLGAPGITLARTETAALQLALEGAYPQGLALTLRARIHPSMRTVPPGERPITGPTSPCGSGWSGPMVPGWKPTTPRRRSQADRSPMAST